MKWSLCCALLVLLVVAEVRANLCISKATCRDCIKSVNSCAWCLQTKMGPTTASNNTSSVNSNNNNKNDQDFNRCDYIENLVKYCSSENIYDPSNEYHVQRDSSFKPLDSDGLAVQIKPQRVSLEMRAHKPHRFNISYQLAEDYPVDLYFLMDLSNSMDVHKNKLSKLGRLLATSMRTITKNFRLGFGSFVEKETLPFVNTAPRSMKNPCGMSTDKYGVNKCVPPYGYIHHMDLTDNSTLFEQEVTDAKVSGNLDSPEGGLDALMQAIVCDKEIGWRPASRKLIVYSTDAGFHFAGDGKLAGIIEPNDGLCHMDKLSKRYTHGLVQDYPSIGEINHKIVKNNVNLIFAVVKNQAPLYKKLAELIEGSFVGELDTDSSNIVQLVVDIYKTIAKKIVFTTDINEDKLTDIGLQVKFFSKCQNHDELVETNACDEIKIKEKVEFQVEVTLTKCPPAGSESAEPITFNVNAQGIDEKIAVSVIPRCECECEKKNTDTNTNVKELPFDNPSCNDRGRIKCGICECHSSFYGSKCECSKVLDAESGISSTGNISSCINPRDMMFTNNENDEISRPEISAVGSSAPVICSNQGRCNCGQCVCNDALRITGKYCECDNESCDRYLSVVCAGNGRCECGLCKCHAGWTSSDCSCSTNNSTCMSSNGLVCNGKGSCVCGKCQCDEHSGYFGRTCEDCPTCPLPCENNKDCVQCKVFGTGNKAKYGGKGGVGSVAPIETQDQRKIIDGSSSGGGECDECDLELQEVEDIDESLIENIGNYKQCQFNDLTDNCTFFFSYDIFNDKRIKYQRGKDCPSTFPTWAIISIIVSGVLLAGFSILIIWKVLDTMQQKRECARFNEEKKKAAWETSENPLYKSATSKFDNPLYNKTK